MFFFCFLISTVLSLHRLFIQLKPLQHKITLTRSRLIYILLVTTIINIFFAVSPYFSIYGRQWNGICSYIDIYSLTPVLSVTLLIFAFLIGMILSYGILLFLLKRKTTSLKLTSTLNKKKLKYAVAAKKLQPIIVVFTLCNLPYVIAILFRLTNDNEIKMIIHRVTLLLMLLNSFFNPILYVISLKDFRTAFETFFNLKSTI